VANTLAFYNMATIDDIKSFIVKALGQFNDIILKPESFTTGLSFSLQ
jgi:hypothetical protein